MNEEKETHYKGPSFTLVVDSRPIYDGSELKIYAAPLDASCASCGTILPLVVGDLDEPSSVSQVEKEALAAVARKLDLSRDSGKHHYVGPLGIAVALVTTVCPKCNEHNTAIASWGEIQPARWHARLHGVIKWANNPRQTPNKLYMDSSHKSRD